ncbi:MAG: NUDIX hydrolase [Planctomycetota bacterium]|jgi:8-oxo-dGTP pyrophosphatase MutT (NUDIX family)
MEHLWDRRHAEITYDAGIFQIRKDRYDFRGQPAGHPFHVIQAPDWVNVVAVTPDQRVVLVRQFRHGVRENCLEIPGGVIDPGDADAAAAGARELLEETGYRGGTTKSLGSVSSNPAILSNRTHSFCISDAQLVAPPQPDAHEAIEVECVPVTALLGLIESGEIHHSLSVVALLRFLTGEHA